MTTFVHGIAATLTVGGTTLTGFLSSATHDLRSEVAELRIIGLANVARLVGLLDSSFSASGPLTSALATALASHRAARLPVSVVFRPLGGASPTFTTQMVITNYRQVAASNAETRFDLELQGDGACVVS